LVRRLSFGDGRGDFQQVRNVATAVARQNPLVSIEFWHAIDVRDFPSMRGFVVPNPSDVVFEIDFLSRHELIPPMTVEGLPPGWEAWAEVRGNQLLVTDRAAFCSRMLTADAFIAIPTYRFGLFADDVACVMSESDSAVEDAIRRVLTSPSTGYSFTESNRDAGLPFAMSRFSILVGANCCLHQSVSPPVRPT
jgi:hypothetical protein